MAPWIAILVPAIIALLGAAVTFGVVKSSAAETAKGQKHLFDAVEELTKAVGTLTTNAAVNAAQRDEISRRITAIEQSLGQHSEQIRILRTKTHMNSNKLTEIDPKWRPYHEDI